MPDRIVLAATMPGVLEPVLGELEMPDARTVWSSRAAADAALARRACLAFVDANPVRAVDQLLVPGIVGAHRLGTGRGDLKCPPLRYIVMFVR